MTRWIFAVLLMLLVPVTAGAAPAGKIVIAQGVDPTTLDTMNQSETPASNLAANIWDTLVERDQTLKIVPALAAEIPKNVAPAVWEIKNGQLRHVTEDEALQRRKRQKGLRS